MQKRPWFHKASGRWVVHGAYYDTREQADAALLNAAGPAPRGSAPGFAPDAADCDESSWWHRLLKLAARDVASAETDPLKRGRVLAQLGQAARQYVDVSQLEIENDRMLRLFRSLTGGRAGEHHFNPGELRREADQLATDIAARRGRRTAAGE